MKHGVDPKVDRWCYFLKFADQLDAEQLPASMDTPPIRRALEVLGMVTQDEHEWARYESRLKGIMDRATDLAIAQDKGILIGNVLTLQKVTKQVQTPRQQLAAMSEDELKKLIQSLEQQLAPPSP